VHVNDVTNQSEVIIYACWSWTTR